LTPSAPFKPPTAPPTDNWTRGVTTFRRAALYASDKALRVNRDRYGKQSHNHGYSKLLPRRLFSLLRSVRIILEAMRQLQPPKLMPQQSGFLSLTYQCPHTSHRPI
jgi:hypothetical protein